MARRPISVYVKYRSNSGYVYKHKQSNRLKEVVNIAQETTNGVVFADYIALNTENTEHTILVCLLIFFIPETENAFCR